MIRRNRKNYTSEFKKEAVKLVTEQGYRVTEAARNLDIHDSVLRRWIKAADPEKGRSYDADRDVLEELKHLRRENHRLKQEREILKKAVAFFAKESV